MTWRDRLPRPWWLLWGACAAAFAVFLVGDALAHLLFPCELVQGSSIYGEKSWSPQRLGVSCSYSVEGRQYVVRPSALRLVVVVGLGLWAWSLRAASRTPAARTG